MHMSMQLSIRTATRSRFFSLLHQKLHQLLVEAGLNILLFLASACTLQYALVSYVNAEDLPESLKNISASSPQGPRRV